MLNSNNTILAGKLRHQLEHVYGLLPETKIYLNQLRVNRTELYNIVRRNTFEKYHIMYKAEDKEWPIRGTRLLEVKLTSIDNSDISIEEDHY